MPEDIAIRIKDYTYSEWRSLAHRNAPDWSEDEMDASWDQHIQFPVRPGTVQEQADG